ncbi:MAG: hypothetical protein PHV23_01830 [Candidatus Gracilibacteria bacterium]|nr:hypothetical protein [Candidatus Gracilibacteria bacterium]
MNIIYYLMLAFFLVSCGTNANVATSTTTTNNNLSTTKSTNQSNYSNSKIDTKTRAS